MVTVSVRRCVGPNLLDVHDQDVVDDYDEDVDGGGEDYFDGDDDTGNLINYFFHDLTLSS